MDEVPTLAFIGGSGLYNFSAISQQESVDIETPFGFPSSPIIIGYLAGRKVAFLARHGIGHFIPPGDVNYRANIYALKSLGVQNIISISACGSLREDYKPGDIVIPDQLFDFTRDRKRSFFERGLVVHIGTADPYCKILSNQVFSAVNKTGACVHQGGTFIVIEGPRFSTKAESNLFREWGMSIIGMTACPEAFLAREAEMCYATMAHVTDYDVWHINEESVSVEMVINTLNKNLKIAQESIIELAKIPLEVTDCDCRHALASSIITHPNSISYEMKNKLSILVEKYISQ
jgi:5'-methylthioadenosine phosphorylase